MKAQGQKAEFIRLRAEGKSYSSIAEELHISKSTCTAWERELRGAIAVLKQEQLEELYNAFFMTKEARIKRLGKTLDSINEALDSADLSQMPPEKLLEYKLKYMEALKSEYTGSTAPYQLSDKLEPSKIVIALGDLLDRVRTGDVTPEQATKESAVLANFLKAFETVEIKAKIDALESIVGSRG